MNATNNYRTTQFSPDRRYRYTLWRELWSGDELFDAFDGTNEGERGNALGQYIMVIGLNPSTADERNDDPTIRRCKAFAKSWGYGALCMTNLFAFRATQPEDMKKAVDPAGPECGKWLCDIAKGAGMILAAWGKHGSFIGRDRNVLSALKAIGKPVYCLGKNSDGSPKHPLYIAANTIPVLL